MHSSESSDPELLALWLGQGQEPAFQAIVARYAGLVHMTARRVSGDDLAAEVSQLTFIALAQKAGSLASHPSLGGWLHATALLQARNVLRKSQRENRKRQRLQTAMENETATASENAWRALHPALDDALASLSAKDREVLLLRFYRALSIREVAGTLGIAIDAAQKRIDRATDRLRGKLVRRGVGAGASLATVLAAGFASDAQAAVIPAPLLSSKALAAAGAASLGSSPFVLFLTTMKAATFVPPAIVLVIAGAWIVSQRQTIHALDRQSNLLESAIAGHLALETADAGSSRFRPATAPGNEKKPGLLWSDIAERLANADIGEIDQMMIDQQIESMSAEAMLAALDEIAGLSVSQKLKDQMEYMVVFPLSRKYPEFAVTHLTGRGEMLGDTSHLVEAMESWAGKDFEAASAWMDAQLSSGIFDTKTLDGKNHLQIQYESAMIRTLLTKDGDLLPQRLSRVPDEWRKEVIMGVATIWRANGKFEPAEEVAFGKLVREQLPPADQMEVFMGRASQASAGGFPAVDQFLDLIEATPDERLRCIARVVDSRLVGISINRAVNRDDIVGLRDWVVTQAPEAVDRFTGEALGKAVMEKGIAPTNYRKMGYSEGAAWAVEFNEAAGSDEVLAAFLKSDGGRTDKEQARVLAGKISDEALRAEILKTLE